MHIESQVGSGTLISIYLPMSAAPQQKLPVPDRPSPDQTDATDKIRTILVVEDDIDLMSIATEALEEFGYNVCSATDGPSALFQLKKNSAIDLLFTDMVMPNGMSGTELADQAQKLRPGLNILLTSGYPRETVKEPGTANDYRAFIAKPYTLAALRDSVLKAGAADSNRTSNAM